MESLQVYAKVGAPATYLSWLFLDKCEQPSQPTWPLPVLAKVVRKP